MHAAGVGRRQDFATELSPRVDELSRRIERLYDTALPGDLLCRLGVPRAGDQFIAGRIGVRNATTEQEVSVGGIRLRDKSLIRLQREDRLAAECHAALIE